MLVRRGYKGCKEREENKRKYVIPETARELYLFKLIRNLECKRALNLVRHGEGWKCKIIKKKRGLKGLIEMLKNEREEIEESALVFRFLPNTSDREIKQSVLSVISKIPEDMIISKIIKYGSDDTYEYILKYTKPYDRDLW